MSHSDDVFWRQLCAYDDPTPEQMARAEAALAQEGEVAPLPPGEVQRLVAGAVRGQPVSAAAGTRKTARRWAVLAAGVVLVSAATLVLWNSRQNSDETLPYENALLLVGESGYEDEARLSALFNIVRASQSAIEALTSLTQEADAQLVERAQEIREQSLLLLDSAPPPPTATELFAPDLEALLRGMQSRSVPIAARLALLSQVERFLSVSLRAVAACRLNAATNEAARAVMIERLRRLLRA